MGDKVRDEVNIYEYLSVLLRHKKLIAAFTAGAMALAVVISLLLPNYYTAKASVMQGSTDASALASSAMSGTLGAASSLLDIKSPSDVWVGILGSSTVRDRIIERFKLREAYDKPMIEGARRALDDHISITKTKDEIVTIAVEDKDPQKAVDMAKAFIEELDLVNRTAIMTSGKSTRLFVEQRLNEAKAELAVIEERIKKFRQDKKAFKLDDQSKALIDSIGLLKGQLMAKEVALETLKTYATDSNPQVQVLKAEIDGLRRQVETVQTGKEGSEWDIFIPTSNYPDLALEYARLLRDAKIQETLFETLTQQYELARIQEAKDSPTIQVLDRPVLPEDNSSPNRGLIIVASTLIGFLFSLIFVLLNDFISKHRI